MIVFLAVFIPMWALAQEIAVDPTSGMIAQLVAWVQSQAWYTVMFAVIGAANAVSMWVPDEYMEKYPPLRYLNMGLNWLSANVFFNKNAPVKR